MELEKLEKGFILRDCPALERTNLQTKCPIFLIKETPGG